jgi:signal transduction histidine kinase
MEEPKESQRWLAYELHDGLLQWVIGARMRIVAELAKVEQQDSRLFGNLLATKSQLDAAMEEARALIAFLEGTCTSRTSLADGLRNLVETLKPEAADRSQELLLSIDMTGYPQVPVDTNWSLLRIMQQAIYNALRHAGSTKIEITCGVDPAGSGLRCQVRDYGVGFDPRLAESRPNHFGLRSMRHRAMMIGAEFTLLSSPGEGCQVTCVLPLDR